MLLKGNPRADNVLKSAAIPGSEKELNELVSSIQRLLALEKDKQPIGFFKAAWRHQAQKGKR